MLDNKEELENLTALYSGIPENIVRLIYSRCQESWEESCLTLDDIECMYLKLIEIFPTINPGEILNFLSENNISLDLALDHFLQQEEKKNNSISLSSVRKKTSAVIKSTSPEEIEDLFWNYDGCPTNFRWEVERVKKCDCWNLESKYNFLDVYLNIIPEKIDVEYLERYIKNMEKELEALSKQIQTISNKFVSSPKAINSYYSEERRKLLEIYKEKRYQLAIRLIEKYNYVAKTEEKFDFHQLTVLEATDFMLQIIQFFIFEKNRKTIEIITGKGNHCYSHSRARLKPKLIDFFDKNKCDVCSKILSIYILEGGIRIKRN